MPRCAVCGANAWYRDRATREDLCPEHARLAVVGATPVLATPLVTRRATASDHQCIQQIALYFWDETEVDCFDQQYDVLDCPATLVCGDDGQVVGFASYAVDTARDSLLLVMLNVLPGYQGRGAGRALLDALSDEAAEQGLLNIIVATSNDDLPALAFYQRLDFRITDVIPGRIARHHGSEVPGFAGIPIRDEIRLACKVRRAAEEGCGEETRSVEEVRG